MEDRKKPVANPFVLLREEFGDWAVLYNPDPGHGSRYLEDTLRRPEALVLPQGSRYVAHPLLTWSEHFEDNVFLSWEIESYVPLAAVFFLEQSPTDAVVPMGQGRATFHVTQLAAEVLRCTRSEHQGMNEAVLRKSLFQDASAFAKQVPAYLLKVSLGGAFWTERERVLLHATSPSGSRSAEETGGGHQF